MESVRAFLRALFKRRTIPALSRFEAKFSFFTPSDWLVVATLGIIMALAAGVLLAGVSLSLTTEVPVRSGIYTEGVVGTPRFVNPLLAISDTDRDLSALVYSGLMKQNPDGTLSPDLAEKYTVSGDGLTYTFTLNPNARFQDGTPVTAEDVAYTVREAQNPDVKSPLRANWEGVAVAVVDPHMVTFTLQQPYAPFLADTTLGILPEHLWAGVTAEQFPFSTLNQRPIGSGPYRVDSVVQSSSGIPTEYHLSAFTSGTRTPYIQNFVFKFYTDTPSLQLAVTQGAVDGAYGVNPSSEQSGHTVNEAILDRVFGVFFNQSQNPVFADQAVRKALDTAVDKNAIVSKVLNGYGAVIDGPLPPQTVGTNQTGTTTEAERIQAAQTILEAAGWKRGTDGVYEKTTTVNKKKQTMRLEFSLATSNVDELKQTANLVAADWNALGASVTVQFFNQNDLTTDVIRPRKYDALLFGLVVGREYDLYPFWHSSQKDDPGLNIALYANSSVDKLLEDARTAGDLATREAKASSAAQTISSETAAVFLYTPYFVYLAPSSAKGISFGTIDTPSDRFENIDEWYLSTERVWPVFLTNISERVKTFVTHW
ncbi:MAG: peptide ABC transporter substrate-binding protein [Patescibacteria group bacterium]|nr:peptide ABC transporter substrate-binding protein [Patescibacteria group bacterium]